MYKTVFTYSKQTSIRVLVNSLFIALLGISTTQVLAQTPLPIASPKKSQPTQTANPIAKKLLGTWEVKNAKNASSSESLKFIFTPAGRLLIVMSQGVSGRPLVYQTDYKIDSKPKPMHLDVTLPEDKKVETIFEFTNDDKLRVELYNSNPGKSRPTTFPEKTPLFEKISNSTNLPKNAKIVDPPRPKTPPNTAPEDKPQPSTTAPEDKPATSEPQNNSGNNAPKK